MFKKKRLFARLSPQQTKHLEAGNSFIALLNIVLFISLAALLFLICLLSLLKPSQKLYVEQEQLVAMEKERDEAFLLKEQKEKELNWILTDPEYFDMVVRDALDMAKPGETILRMEEAPPLPAEGDDSPKLKKGLPQGALSPVTNMAPATGKKTTPKTSPSGDPTATDKQASSADKKSTPTSKRSSRRSTQNKNTER